MIMPSGYIMEMMVSSLGRRHTSQEKMDIVK